MSAANLRMIGESIAVYSNKNTGDYPDSISTLFLQGNLQSNNFISPFTNDTPALGATPDATAATICTPGHCSYKYLGAGLTTKSVSSNDVIAYEPAVNALHKFNVLFGDGHVQACSPVWLAKLNANLAKRPPASTQPVTLAPG